MFFILFVQNFTKAGEQEAVRCDTKAQLMKRGCKREEIIAPENTIDIVKADPLSVSFDKQLKEPVQLSPQKISLRLRPGEWNQLMRTFVNRRNYSDLLPVLAGQ